MEKRQFVGESDALQMVKLKKSKAEFPKKQRR